MYRLKRFRGTNAALLDFCFRIERHASTSVPVKTRLRLGTMPSCGIFPYSRSILFLMHVRNLYSSAETQGLAILLPRLSGIGRKPSSLSGGEARSCLGGETLQKARHFRSRFRIFTEECLTFRTVSSERVDVVRFKLYLRHVRTRLYTYIVDLASTDLCEIYDIIKPW